MTKKRFLKILGQFLFIGGATLLISLTGYLLVYTGQVIVETYLPQFAYLSAVIALTLLQFFLLLNLVLSTIGIFYIIINQMNDKGMLLKFPNGFSKSLSKPPIGHQSRFGLLVFLLACSALE